MEFVRVKYANNKLINANLKEHHEIIEEYVMRRGCTYLGFVPVIFTQTGKVQEADLIFKKPAEKKEVIKQTEAKPETKPETKKK